MTTVAALGGCAATSGGTALQHAPVEVSAKEIQDSPELQQIYEAIPTDGTPYAYRSPDSASFEIARYPTGGQCPYVVDTATIQDELVHVSFAELDAGTLCTSDFSVGVEGFELPTEVMHRAITVEIQYPNQEDFYLYELPATSE
ncbi:hypothetical protein [Pseudoclavibacter sp. VKM Ac-2888]|uniref:hypothetical protein n=1 Tax=Pseudoclavibacter sp. VKM Ac-2888 TaxID=2783830 RepID=UPI00188A1459|nr:hypothetical protein [Pseudoclavibacter sp. VKM Ac-2888]MBF4549339.1 hypothetical protein [Pseudoclavibacter sp. VKM Ac-2888]